MGCSAASWVKDGGGNLNISFVNNDLHSACTRRSTRGFMLTAAPRSGDDMMILNIVHDLLSKMSRWPTWK